MISRIDTLFHSKLFYFFQSEVFQKSLKNPTVSIKLTIKDPQSEEKKKASREVCVCMCDTICEPSSKLEAVI